jgi:hypothetical protein
VWNDRNAHDSLCTTKRVTDFAAEQTVRFEVTPTDHALQSHDGGDLNIRGMGIKERRERPYQPAFLRGSCYPAASGPDTAMLPVLARLSKLSLTFHLSNLQHCNLYVSVHGRKASNSMYAVQAQKCTTHEREDSQHTSERKDKLMYSFCSAHVQTFSKYICPICILI